MLSINNAPMNISSDNGNLDIKVDDDGGGGGGAVVVVVVVDTLLPEGFLMRGQSDWRLCKTSKRSKLLVHVMMCSLDMESLIML